jgi:catechol 2,3-dioxygenase-like lactoylglutathione lyase family enzyme
VLGPALTPGATWSEVAVQTHCRDRRHTSLVDRGRPFAVPLEDLPPTSAKLPPGTPSATRMKERTADNAVGGLLQRSTEEAHDMPTVSVRYIVNDVDAAIEFYCQHLGFHEDMHPAPTFAMLSHGDLRLVLSAPGGGPGGGQTMPDGRVPEPGGWNRFQLEVSDLVTTVERLRRLGVCFRNDVVVGVGGKQILLDDPSGNPVELFEPTLPEASLHR